MPTPDPDKQTPRTTEVEFRSYGAINDEVGELVVPADFARQLERESATQLQELQRAKREVGELRGLLDGARDSLRIYEEMDPVGGDGDPCAVNVAMARIRAIDATLARPAHPEELADKGGEK